MELEEKLKEFVNNNNLQYVLTIGTKKCYISEYFYGRKKDKSLVVNVEIDISKEYPTCSIKHIFGDLTVITTQEFGSFLDNQERFDSFYINVANRVASLKMFFGEE